jgi:UDP-N-acetylmuramyl tripeptide synthase
MTLGALVAAARTLAPDARQRVTQGGRDAVPVTGSDSRFACGRAGTVFVAVRGQRSDGATFAADAVRRGAIAVIAESAPPAGVAVPWLRTTDARLALAELAAIVNGHPSDHSRLSASPARTARRRRRIAGVGLRRRGMPCGRIGTVTVRTGPSPSDERDASHTTPEASELQRLLREMADRGCRACAIEVSSHALVLQRVANIRFAGAIFTNLTRDHLDFHGDMQQYFAAKRRLFEMLPRGAPASINVDDPRGVELAAMLPR